MLVDEYQDTNALQDAIYFALARPEADNLFFVGDIKQSIYRFRLADPGIFVDKQQRWQPHPQPAPLPSTLALDANFRSAPGVIAGINYLFETFFSRGLGGVDYGDGQRLVVGGDKDAAYQGMCEIDVIDGADVDGDAAVIARRIAEMVGQGFPVRGKDGPRPCRYDDFCILLRGRKGFAAYEGALRTAGIPVFADSATDLLDEPHIRPFAALLRVIDNPAQDIPLAAVLLSPMFPYTADDLVALRRARPTGSLYGAVLYSEPQRFALFTDALTEYRRLARTLPVDELIEELLARTGYLAAVGALPDGPRCREDLLSFTAWAAGAGRAGLPSLIRAMDAAAANGGLSQSAGGQTRPGCVSIMTVHRSKGLEFPVVFVADTDHKFNQSDAIRPVLTHSRLGVGVMLRAPRAAKRFKTLPYAALAQAIRTETLSEEMRVLYVALTRAQDALIITVPLKKTAFPQAPGALRCRRGHRPRGHAQHDELGGLDLDRGAAPPGQQRTVGVHELSAALRAAPRAAGHPRAAPAGGDRTAARTTRPRGRPGSGGNAEGQLCLAQSARGAGKGARQGQRQRRGPRGAARSAGAPRVLAENRHDRGRARHSHPRLYAECPV